MEKESNNPFVFFSGYQGGGSVDPGQEFLVQGIQPFGIAAEQFEFLDQVADVLFFFPLTLLPIPLYKGSISAPRKEVVPCPLKRFLRS